VVLPIFGLDPIDGVRVAGVNDDDDPRGCANEVHPARVFAGTNDFGFEGMWVALFPEGCVVTGAFLSVKPVVFPAVCAGAEDIEGAEDAEDAESTADVEGAFFICVTSDLGKMTFESGNVQRFAGAARHPVYAPGFLAP